MIGTIVNVATVLAGGLIGLIFNEKVPKRFIDTAFNGIGLFTIALGVMMSIKSNELLYLVFSVIIGSLIGEALDLDQRLNDFGEGLKKKIGSNNSNFTNGLITSFLLFCMGSMTVIGSIQEGLGNNSELLFTKAIMDGFAAIALASTLGIGVLFSVIPLFIYQGGLTLLAGSLETFVTNEVLLEAVITELSAVGGLLLLGLGFNILKITTIKVTNMLPSLIVILLFMFLL